MSTLQISEAFKRYGARLKNVQWSVSAWTPDGELVVSLWAHHYQKGTPGAMEFTDSFAHWCGPGNSEFRRNVLKAWTEKLVVRLVLVKAKTAGGEKLIEASGDPRKVPKEYVVRNDVVGEVSDIEGERCAFRFKPLLKAPRPL